MKYLLDTHTIFWAAENNPLLSEKAKEIILDDHSEKYISIVSAWEVAIKLGTQKLYIDGGLPEFFKIIDENGLIMLSVEREYLQLIPIFPGYHKDPFDHLIIATAISEGLIVVTGDKNIHRYNVICLW